MSGVTCQVSYVTWHVLFVNFLLLYLFIYKLLELVGGGSVFEWAYPDQFLDFLY